MAKANVNNQQTEINQLFNQLPPSDQKNFIVQMRHRVSLQKDLESYVQKFMAEGLTEAEARQRLDDGIAASLENIKRGIYVY